MLLLLLNYVVLRTLLKIDVYLISTLVNKSIYYYYSYILFLVNALYLYVKNEYLKVKPMFKLTVKV